MFKGQVNFEFLAAALLFLTAIGGILLAGNQLLPSFHTEMESLSTNLEAKTVTDKILSEPGTHSYGSGGTDWDKNSSTLQEIESFGLAKDFLEVERSKVENLSTRGSEDLNYTVFRETTGAENHYNMRFVWLPVIHTSQGFTRGDPPSKISEPGGNNLEPYISADDTVKYGSSSLEDETHKFLVTSSDGSYDAVYVSDDWDFNIDNRYSEGETFSLTDTEYIVESFQNREDEEGSILVLKKEINSFGVNPDTDVPIQRMDRFAIMDNEPLRVEVLAW